MHKVPVHFGHDGQGEGRQTEAVVTTRWEGRREGEGTGEGRRREGEGMGEGRRREREVMGRGGERER